MIEGSGSVPLTNNPDLDPGGPKTYGSGSATLLQRVLTKVSQTLYAVVQ